jgi:hypothetical protein
MAKVSKSGNTGKFRIFRDPQGNTIGLFMPYPMT